MRISMPRGDIKLVRFIIKNSEDEAPDFDFTEIYFTVKRTTREETYQFQKRLSTGGIVKLDWGDYQVKIQPEDTRDMQYGRYKFDIQINFEDQVKETFVGDFVLTDEVTHDENE